MNKTKVLSAPKPQSHQATGLAWNHLILRPFLVIPHPAITTMADLHPLRVSVVWLPQTSAHTANEVLSLASEEWAPALESSGLPPTLSAEAESRSTRPPPCPAHRDPSCLSLSAVFAKMTGFRCFLNQNRSFLFISFPDVTT